MQTKHLGPKAVGNKRSRRTCKQGPPPHSQVHRVKVRRRPVPNFSALRFSKSASHALHKSAPVQCAKGPAALEASTAPPQGTHVSWAAASPSMESQSKHKTTSSSASSSLSLHSPKASSTQNMTIAVIQDQEAAQGAQQVEVDVDPNVAAGARPLVHQETMAPIRKAVSSAHTAKSVRASRPLQGGPRRLRKNGL